MSTLKEIGLDILIILQLVLYEIYCMLELLVKNVTPSSLWSKDIAGSAVLITGAAGGIGKNLVKKFLRQKCKVVCVDVNKSEMAKLKKDLESEFSDRESDIFYYDFDISSIDQVKLNSAKIKSDCGGKVDILINNAGIMNEAKLFMELKEVEILRIFNVNVFAQFWLIREFLPEMIRENKGHIVNVSSVCGIAGGYRVTDYCASKFAVSGLTESLRAELNVMNPNNQVQVSGVFPFHVKTALFNGADIPRLKWLGLSIEPEEVAESIVNGVRTNKDMIMIPKVGNHIFAYIKYLVPTKCTQLLHKLVGFQAAMNNYKKVQ